MEEKKRHGCVTAWLSLMIVVNSFSAMLYFFARQMMLEILQGIIPEKMLITMGFLAFANAVFAVFILQWKKIGFWGFALTSVITFILNLQMGMGVSSSIFGMVGIAILYGVLQIKQDGVCAWDNLE